MSDVISTASDTSLAGTAEPSGEPWWKGAVIYQIYPRSYRDTTGDGIGDLKGICEKLDHVASLGVDAIWLSPFFTSPMHDYGYDVADYCDVDPIFGTLEDFDALVEKAHRLGLKVIIDQVYSHTSDEHPWFAESREDRTNPKADWYVWADAKPDGSPPSNWQSVFGGPAWQWDARRKQYYMHNFLTSQPDLNLHNRAVQDVLLDAARFWLDRGVDGFRLDAINFAMHDRKLTDNPPSGLPMDRVTRPFDMQRHVNSMSQPEVPAFLERIRALLDQYGVRFTVAEVGGPQPLGEMKAFTEGEARLNSAYSFDFLYAQDLTIGTVQDSLSAWSGAEGEGWPSWAFSNHDAPRAVSRWSGAHDQRQVSRLLMLLLLSLRGNAFIYQGEELGLPQADVPFEALKDPEAIENWPHTLGRDGARTPMPWTDDAPFFGFSRGDAWLPPDPAHGPLCVTSQEASPGSCLNVTRQLLRLRQDAQALRIGAQSFLHGSNAILAFERSVEDDLIVCAFNLGDVEAVWRPEGGGEKWQVLATQDGVVDSAAAFPGRLAPKTGYWARRKRLSADNELD
ncbi:MAG: alpha-amylase family glycosyl hydrolase [Hyphomonadaceae bacterium]|nr:alpha-amylase family glycosyl hydrolase [Hyphomonadaceae bacterium]